MKKTKYRVPTSGNRFLDKRSKLTDSSFEFAINLRHPVEGEPLFWGTIADMIFDEYGISITEQAVLQLYNRYKNDVIITKLSEHMLEKRKEDIQDYYIKLSDKPDLKFKGVLILDQSDKHQRIKIYSTEGANLIASKTVKGVTDAIHVLLVADITDFLGWSDLAKDVYSELGVERYIEVK